MESKEKYLILKEKYEQLAEQSALILKEQEVMLEELKKICPHTDTSEPFADFLLALDEVKVCKICKSTLYFHSKQNVWK